MRFASARWGSVIRQARQRSELRYERFQRALDRPDFVTNYDRHIAPVASVGSLLADVRSSSLRFTEPGLQLPMTGSAAVGGETLSTINTQ